MDRPGLLCQWERWRSSTNLLAYLYHCGNSHVNGLPSSPSSSIPPLLLPRLSFSSFDSRYAMYESSFSSFGVRREMGFVDWYFSTGILGWGFFFEMLVMVEVLVDGFLRSIVGAGRGLSEVGTISCLIFLYFGESMWSSSAGRLLYVVEAEKKSAFFFLRSVRCSFRASFRGRCLACHFFLE